MQGACRVVFRPQEPLQHPAARKRLIEVQFVYPAHQGKISAAGGTWQVTDVARLVPGCLVCLLTGRSWLRSVIVLRSKGRLTNRTFQKIVDQCQLSDLRMEGFNINGRGLWLSLHRRAKHPDGTFKKLITPLLDLIGVDIELLRQFQHRLLALDRSQSYHRLKGGRVVPAHPSCHVGYCSQLILNCFQAETTLIQTVQIPRTVSVFGPFKNTMINLFYALQLSLIT
jgi:hypothetical protein